MRILLSVAVAITLAASAGCTSAPLQNIASTPVVSPAGKPLTPDQVRLAIIRAGAGLGWVVTDAGPGMLNARLMIRTHMAEVAIPYSATQYSITYKSSINLQEGGGTIHRNYNGWIQNLNRGINAQLAVS